MPTPSEQKSYNLHLEEKDLEILARLLGEPLLDLYAPELRVHRFWSSSPCFSMSMGDGNFLAIESDWAATPENTIDFHQLSLKVLDHPQKVPFELQSDGRKRMVSPTSVVDIGPPKSGIRKITLLRTDESRGNESVSYDSGLIFELADGRRIAIVVHQSIAGGLEAITESSVIEQILAEQGIRLELEAFSN